MNSNWLWMTLLGLGITSQLISASNAPIRNKFTDSMESSMGMKPKPESACLKDRGYHMGSACKQSDTNGWMASVEEYLRGEEGLVDASIPCDEEQHDTNLIVDYIVAGSGVGSVVARRLAEANHTVAILEAGGPAPVCSQVPSYYFNLNGHPDYDWNFKLEKQDNACLSYGGVCHWPRGKMMGGTTQLHGMMYMRGYPQDFDDLNISGWGWDDVLPYFLKSEDNKDIGKPWVDDEHHATGGLLTVSRFNDHPALTKHVLAAAEHLGYKTNHDLNGNYRTGCTLAQATTRNGERLSTSRAYLYDVDNPTQDGRLKVLMNAHVTRVIFDGKRAIGVEYEKNDKTFFVEARKEVIISAGSVQSPQILMLSGIGPKEHLEEFGIKVVHNLPGVGKNLKNHASVSMNYLVNEEEGYNTMNKKSVKEFLKKRKGPLTSTGLSQMTCFDWSKDVDAENEAPNIQIFFAGYLANCSTTGKEHELVDPSFPHRLISITPTLLRPESHGQLGLRSSHPKSPPKINANLLSSQKDIDVIMEGVRLVKKLVQAPPLNKMLTLDPTPVKGCESHKLNSDEYWACVIIYETNPENHQVGTCKMGHSDDPMAVTDNRLRVHGVKNLRVIDSSIFPNVPSGNLVAPAIMAAEKGAAMVIEDNAD